MTDPLALLFRRLVRTQSTTPDAATLPGLRLAVEAVAQDILDTTENPFGRRRAERVLAALDDLAHPQHAEHDPDDEAARQAFAEAVEAALSVEPKL